MSNDSNGRKLPTSFSSPEFEADSSAAAMVETSESKDFTNNGLTVSFTSSNSSQTIKTFTATGIKLNTTRDSGFSDSIIEDTSYSTTSSSTRTFCSPTHRSNQSAASAAAATEHMFNVTQPDDGSAPTDVTMTTKCYANKGTYWLTSFFLN